jgi:hypothetical protein
LLPLAGLAFPAEVQAQIQVQPLAPSSDHVALTCKVWDLHLRRALDERVQAGDFLAEVDMVVINKLVPTYLACRRADFTEGLRAYAQMQAMLDGRIGHGSPAGSAAK